MSTLDPKEGRTGSGFAVTPCDVRLLASNPAATVVPDGTRLAVGHGLDREGERLLREAMHRPDPTGAMDDLVTGQEEATIVFADCMASGGPVLAAWRGATSNFDVYIVDNGPGQPPTVTDHLRDALALLPSERRLLDPQAVADHLLFGTVPGTRTYVQTIGRLGHGEHLRWQSGRVERRHFDPLIARPRKDRLSLDDIDAALARAIGRLPVADDCVNQLSGGIDSSLLHTYLPPGTPAVSGAVDSPEFARERGYAEQASRLLGTKHQTFWASEGEYLKLLIDMIRRSGQPTRMPQSVAFQLTFQSAPTRFVNGEFADALFGLKPSRPYILAFDQRHLLNLAKTLGLARLLPSGHAKGLRRRIERLRRIEVPVGDWRGLGARYTMYTNSALAERILGATTVQQRGEARAAYVAERFRSEERDANPLFAHLEFGHMMTFLCGDGASRWRQMAHTHGKSLLLPFLSRSVVAQALAVPRGRRYIADGRIKYLLKDLLKRRLPAFDVDAPKAGGDLPLARYLSSGPLKDAFERYAMPDFVDRDIAAATRAAPDWLTWNLLTLAIWRDEVLADAALAPLPGTRVLALSAGMGGR